MRDDELTEQIAEALLTKRTGGKQHLSDPYPEGLRDYWCDLAAAVLPIVRAAQAQALRDAASVLEASPLDDPDAAHTPQWLDARADTIEKGTDHG